MIRRIARSTHTTAVILNSSFIQEDLLRDEPGLRGHPRIEVLVVDDRSLQASVCG